MIEYTYDHDVLDLANLELDSIFALEVLPEKALALFASNGTVLILQEGGSGSYKVLTAMKLLGVDGIIDEDSLIFTAIYKMSHRNGMFLCETSDGLHAY